MYVFTVYALCVHLNDLWRNTCGLVSRRGTCFWDCRSMHVQHSVKSVRRAKHTYYVERVSRIECGFAPHRTWGYDSFSRWPRALFATVGTAALSRTHRFQRRLLGIVAAFTLSVSSPVALSFSLPSPFCRRNNETASATTALDTINFKQIFVNRIF